MRPPEYRINLTVHEINQLEQLIRKSTAPQNQVRRAKIILMANGEGKSNKEIADLLDTTSAKVTTWTKRWIDRALDWIEERLSALPRPGSPSKITPKQWCQIMAGCCKPPQEYGYPISHWTGPELVPEVVKQGLIESISVSQLNDFLKKPNYHRIALATG